jgi:NAD(P)-dependent dehydrogenase (short-subunit alcohol dehydrogenase family)
MGSLDERVAIVTGGARGIGRAYCLGLAKEGAKVLSADMADSSETVAAVKEAGGDADQVITDVSDKASTEQMAAFAVERFGRIDILVNNAGYFVTLKRGPWTDIPVDEWDKAFHINVRGVWLCCLAVWPQMKEQGYGKIINITSNVIYRGVPNFLHYSASKSALVGLTRSLAREVGEHGISVNAVAPEYIPSSPELTAVNPPGQNEMVVQQRIFKRTQLPEDMVGTILFLAGPGSDFITGQSILVNGGSCFI